MKKRKLELKDVVGYLPYGMLFQEQKDHTVLRMDNIESIYYPEIWATQKYIRGLGKDVNDINYPYLSANNCSGQGFKLKEIKPILHPMSDLTNSIAVKGYNEDKEFIPLIELAKYRTGNEGIKYEYKKTGLEPYNATYYVDVKHKGAHLWELDFLNQWMFDYRVS